MNTKDLYYLRENVYVEPLVNNWYAWPNLIAPVTYSMYMNKVHRRLMNSFVKNYQLHIIARQHTSEYGAGEFVACEEEQVEDVKALLHALDSEHLIYVQLAQAVKQLDDLLREHHSGKSLEPLYAHIPDMLKGYVELTMDLFHQPSYRLIEGLLYRSPYYNEQLQSVSLGLLASSTDRHFVMSTPRVASEETLNIQVPFASPFWDKLFQLREYPASKADIDELLSGHSKMAALTADSLFTVEPPLARNAEYSGEGVRLRYSGHAGFIIQTKNCNILIDPILPYRTEDLPIDAVSFSDLPEKIDYVCLTHNHSDHVNLETLLQLRYKIKKIVVPKNNGGTLADPSLKLLLCKLGFNVCDMDDLEEIPLPGGRLLSIPFLGEHGDLNIRSKAAWLIELNGKKIYAGADSSNLDSNMYTHVYKTTGKFDVLAIGLECIGAPYTWLYGALTTRVVDKDISESRRLNGADFEKAAGMVDIFKPRHVLIYALGLESWCRYFTGAPIAENSTQTIESEKLMQYCRQRDIPVQRLYEHYELCL